MRQKKTYKWKLDIEWKVVWGMIHGDVNVKISICTCTIECTSVLHTRCVSVGHFLDEIDVT